MPKTRPPYAPEFRRQMVELVHAGRDPAELAREFEPTAQSISHWVAQADRQEGPRRRRATGFQRLSVRNRPGCGVRTSSCSWSATSSLERPPGSHARPARSRPGLRIDERAPGHLSGWRDGARARRVGVRLSCVASPAICTRHRGHRAAEADPHRPRQLTRDVWCAAGAGRAQGRRREARAQAHRPTNARGRTGRRQPPALRADDHAAGQGSQTRP
jgi:hypothetical protein